MPKRQKITFSNAQGQQLAAALEVPDGQVKAYALFAHCFTCGKNIAAASRISRTLASHGIAVLRFDFTGLGDSEGDFGNSNFSSNVDDLVSAAAYLENNYCAPKLLIGHSLGGTAVLAAADQLKDAVAVVTIGAPASPEHVLGQFSDRLDDIRRRGKATVALAGREFELEQQFVEDLRAHPLTQRIARLKKALLVFHAPFDDTVSIDQATQIFSAARHPKSFVSLDKADHLVSHMVDAQYVATTIAAWATRYLPESEPLEGPDVAGGEVYVGEGNLRFLREVHSDDHAWVSDEPRRLGGDNLGPDPYEQLLSALGTCTSMTIRMYANRKEWPLDDVEVRLSHAREHVADCQGCDDGDSKVDLLRRSIRLIGDLSASQRERLMEIADRCPVHQTLEGPLKIVTEQAH